MRHFHRPGRSPVFATSCMVATSHPLAASEALSVLRDGGNAVDAAIAGAVLLGVCEPHMTGLGGDCFALVKPAGEDRIIALNGSGRAPAGLDVEELRAEGAAKIPVQHPAAVTIPGAVDALCRLSDDWGKLGLERCLAPAIRHYRTGVPIAPRVASDWARLDDALLDTARSHFLPGGTPPNVGDIFALPAQAEVLERIAAHGRDAFYKGEIAEDMVAGLQAAGGAHAIEDFAATKASWGEPISGTYKGRELIEHPPNGQGATAILLANILSQFDMAALDPAGAARTHLLAEATKLAYDARNRILADPDHTARLAHMMAPETAEKLAGLIAMDRAMEGPARLTEEVHKDTILITTADRDGMMVTLIYSIFASFGSGIASPKYGILFHNRGSGFTLERGHVNEALPGKRPMHTIIPAMLKTDGRVSMAFGVMGGQYQATGHAHVLSNLLDHGMDVQEALDAPRSFAVDGRLQLEDTFADRVKSDLADLGHDIVAPPTAIGGGQAIEVDRERGVYIGGSHPRKDGLAIGY